MAVHITIFDGVNPMIDFIAQRHYGLAKESLSVAGSKVRKQAENKMKSYYHNWINKLNSDGKYITYKSNNKKKRFGDMISHRATTLSSRNIGEIITSYMPDNKLEVIIGGDHKSFRPLIYEKGLAVGTMKRVKRVSKATRAIFHKMNTGEITKEHPYSNKSRTKYPDATYTARPFLNNAMLTANSEVISSIEKRYVQVLPGLVANANIKVVKVS